MKVICTINISFGTLSEFISDFGKKNIQVCRNSNLSVESKDFEKILLNIWFFIFLWNLTRKTCFFTGKFLVGLSKLLFTCPEKHLRSNISETKSWKLGDFRIFFEFFGTMAENIFRVWQNSNRCPEGTDYWKTFSKEKISLIFPFLSEFFFERKNSLGLRNPQSTYPWKLLR